MNSDQRYALESMKMRTAEANKPVSLRVKPLLVIAILSALASLYGLTTALSGSLEAFAVIAIILYLVELSLSVYLLVSSNQQTVGLILKIYLVLQLLSLFSSFGNLVVFMLHLAMVGVLFYVISRVKALTNY